MLIIAPDAAELDSGEVHAIDLWFSSRRGVWIVERLGRNGCHVGLPSTFTARPDAEACVDAWLDAHALTHPTRAGTRESRGVVARRPSRRAA